MNRKAGANRHCSPAVLLLACVCGIASADIVTDGTVGAVTTLTGSMLDIEAELGQLEGTNLFHSFTRFDIDTGQTATFLSPVSGDSVTNIISRVTGGFDSNIDGALMSRIPGANVYLVNPSGVVFGENASIHVGGTFYVSSAHYLALADGGRFDAVDPAASVLTTAPVSAFGFLDAPESISFRTGSTLQLVVQPDPAEIAPGDEIAVVAGDILMEDAILQVPSGRVQLVSVASGGEAVVGADGIIDVSGFPQLGRIAINHTGNFFRRRIASVDVSGDSAGQVYIRAGQLLMDFGYIFADNTNGTGGLVDIEARDRVELYNEARITADSLGTGSGGTVRLTTRDLVLRDGGILQVDSYSDGAGGRLEVAATDSVTVSGSSPTGLPYIGDVASGLYADSLGNGPGGSISVDAPQVTIENGGRIQLNSELPGGDAGTLDLDAGALQVRDGGIIVTDTFGAGNAGLLDIDVATLELHDGGSIVANTRGTGTGGTIDINATDRVDIAGSKLVTGNDGSQTLVRSGLFSNTGGQGDGGGIVVVTGNLDVADGAAIQSGAAGGAATAATHAGNIDISADTIVLSGQGQVSTQSENAAAAGTISIQANDSLTIISPAGNVRSGVFSSSLGSGQGGNITISGGALLMDGGVIDVSSTQSGDAGSIDISVAGVDMHNGALVRSSVDGSGSGGTVLLSAAGDVRIDGQSGDGFRSGLYSQTAGTGTGGDIQVSAVNVFLTDTATIDSASLGSGDAGNIDVTGVSTVQLDNASITTAAANADGGNIKVTAADLVYLKDSDITAAVGGGLGNGGNVGIDPQFVVLSNSNVLASAIGGNGGNITIIADHFISSADSVLNASSQLGIDGTITILSPDEEVNSNQVELPVAYLDAAGLLKERCSARRLGEQGSSLTVSGRDALPLSPQSSHSLLSGPGDSRYGAARGMATGDLSQQWLGYRLAAARYGCTL